MRTSKQRLVIVSMIAIVVMLFAAQQAFAPTDNLTQDNYTSENLSINITNSTQTNVSENITIILPEEVLENITVNDSNNTTVNTSNYSETNTSKNITENITIITPEGDLQNITVNNSNNTTVNTSNHSGTIPSANVTENATQNITLITQETNLQNITVNISNNTTVNTSNHSGTNTSTNATENITFATQENNFIMIVNHGKFKHNADITSAIDTETGKKTGISKNKHYTVEINLSDGRILSFTGLFIGNSTEIKYESLNNTGFANSYAIDLSGLNFTTATLTATAQQTEIYKCKEWDFASQTCNGSWNKITDAIPGQQYSISLTADDPGFGEFNSSEREGEISTTSASPVTAIQLNFTPTEPQYLLIGYAEMQGNNTNGAVGALCNLNGTMIIGNLSWYPDTVTPSTAPGDYVPFFTHNLTTLNIASQNLSVGFYTNETRTTAFIRRARAIALGVGDRDAVSNGTTSAQLLLTPADVYHAVTNLSFTPAQSGPVLVLASAELIPNSTTELISARLSINGTKFNTARRTGTKPASNALFAVHDVINVSSGVQQNISIEAMSATTANKAVRNARITAVPLSEVFMNSSETGISTTSTTFIARLNLYFTLNSASDVLLLGSANTTINSATNGRFINIDVLIDGTSMGNMTQGLFIAGEALSFITAEYTNLSAGAHNLSMQFRRIGGVATTNVTIDNARLAVIPMSRTVFNFTNISVTKTSTPNPVRSSTNLTYQINVSSTANGTAYNVTVNDTYSTRAIYITSQPTPLAGTNNTWILGNLTQGTNISINITVLVLNTTNGTLMNNTINVIYSNETGALLSVKTTINTTIANIPPYISIVSPQNTTYGNATVLVNISTIYADNVWFFNGTANETYTTPVYRTFSEGANTLTVYANDTFGNLNLTNVSFSIYTTPPAWSDPAVNETSVYWNTSIRFNTTWTSGVNLSGYIFSINQSGWTNSSFVQFGGLTNTSQNITTITADEETVVQWYFWANNSLGNYNQTDVQNFTVQPRPTSLIFAVNQTVYAQGYGSTLATQYYIPINSRYIDSLTGNPISGANCNATNNETTEIVSLVYTESTGNYTGNMSTHVLYDNVSLSVACSKLNYANNSNSTSAKVWFIMYLWEGANKSFDGSNNFTTFLQREAPSGALYTKTINSDLAEGDNLVQEFNYCGTGANCSLNRDYQVTNGVFSMKLNMSINDTACKPRICYFYRDPDFNKIYEDCNTTQVTIPANTATIVENNITDTHTLPQGYFIGTSLYLNCSSAVSEQVNVSYNYTGEEPSFIITHPQPLDINTFIAFSSQVEKNYTIGPNQRINETRMSVITFNNTLTTSAYTDYTHTPRIYAEYTNSIIPNTSYVYNSTGDLWASDNASAGAPGVATVYSNNQIKWRTEIIPNQTLKNETVQALLLDCARDDEILLYNTTTTKIWNISLYSILTTIVSTYNLTVWTNYSVYDGFTDVNFTANISNSSGTNDITSLALINTTSKIITFPNLTLTSTASILVRVYGQPLQKPYVKIAYPLNETIDTSTNVPIIANISDPLGINYSLANVTLPNGSARNATFGLVQQPDSFEANTMNTSWWNERTIGPSQTCVANINSTIPNQAFTSIDGNALPLSLSLCTFVSKSILYKDFDINITFNLTHALENDSSINLQVMESPSSANASKLAFILLIQRTSLGQNYEVYASDGNISTTLSRRPTNDTSGKFRIKRTGTNFTFYSWNGAWQQEASSNLNFSYPLYVSFEANNFAPLYGSMNASWSNFSVNTFNYSVAFVNETNTTGIYNVTVIAVNSIGGINRTEKTNFTIAQINQGPSVPYIFNPLPGVVVSGLYNITWAQVYDHENDNVWFNITLMNPDESYNATIILNYGNLTTTRYEWNTSAYSPGHYALKVEVFENETAERYSSSDTTNGNFTLNHAPIVVVIAPINKSFPERRRVSLVINASDADGIDTAIASVTLPNNSVENLTMGYGQVSDNFSTDTMNTYWSRYNSTGSSQTCIANIDTTTAGKAYISLSGEGTPKTDTYCIIGSSRAIDSDFDINVSFDILSNIGKDGLLNFALTEVSDPTTTTKTIIFAVSNWSGYEPGYEVYVDDQNSTTGYIGYVESTDVSGKLRIKRTGSNFTFYNWNSTSGAWHYFNTSANIFDFARGLYASLQIESSYPGWGGRNATFENFSVNSANTTFAIFNDTALIGNYNVSFIVNDTLGTALGITNRDAFTNFSVYYYNSPPSVPWILSPYIGQIISRLFSITWTQSVDQDSNSMQFNITLLNSDLTHNSTIVSYYGNENSTNYQWNTTTVPDGAYSLNVTVFENNTIENKSNSNVLPATFSVDNTPPKVINVTPESGLSFGNNTHVNISANVTDAISIVDAVIAEILLLNSTRTNYTLSNSTKDIYSFEFNDTSNMGQYDITFFANDTQNNINGTVTTDFTITDIKPPTVFGAHPSAGYGAFLPGNVSVSALATDNSGVSAVIANITLPNGAKSVIELTNMEYAADNGTLLLLHLNEESGALIDNSGNSDTAVFHGTAYTQNVTGKFNKAVQFAGSDAYISATNPGQIFDFNENQSFSIEAWINVTDISTIQPIICKLDPADENTPAYVLAVNTAGTPYFMARNATNTNFTVTAVTNVLGAMHHVAGVRNTASQQCRIYVDGMLEATTTCPAFDTTNSPDLIIGRTCDTTSPIEGLIDEVRVSNTTRTGFSPNYYNAYFANLTQKGRYNVTFFANGTKGNINATTTTYFVRKAVNIIDLIDYNNNRVSFTIASSNSSGVLSMNITPNSTIQEIQAAGYYESSPNSILRIDTAINESIFLLDSNYTIDASEFNFTTLNITRTATSGTIAYKCDHFNITTRACIDLCANGTTPNCPLQPNGLWAPFANITAGQNYTFLLTNATDPGFAEWNASQRDDEINTTSTTPITAIQSNITPIQGQYLLIGYSELQGASNNLDIGALLELNDTVNVGNASWQPDTSRTSNPPGEYAQFFTHQLTNLNSDAQNLSLRFFAESGQNTIIRRARAINVRVNNNDALTNDSGSTFQTLTSADTYQSVANLSFTPEVKQPYLIIASAEVAPNNTTESVLARLMQNNTERAYLSYEGKATTDIVVFATQLVVNATANVTQNFTLQAQSQSNAGKQIRRARITAIPLSEVFRNESLGTTETTSSLSQNKTTLHFTLDSERNVLILASADVNISSCTNGNFIGASLSIDGTAVGNLTQGCQDFTDSYSFITTQLTNLSAGSHTAVITFNRMAGSGGTVAIRQARITVAPISPLLNFTNISITKTDTPDPVNVSDWLNYTITITSNGNGTAYNVSINDTYPAAVFYVSAQPAPTASNNTWLIGTMLPGATITINVTVNVTANAPNGTIISNTANVTYNNETSGLLTKTATASTTVRNPIVLNISNISITKTDSPDPVEINNPLNYTITIISSGDATAHNVTLNDTYPNGLIYITSQPAPIAGTNNTWILGNLSPGTRIYVNISLLAPNAPNGTVINNTANATFQNDTSGNISYIATQNTTIFNPPYYNFSNISVIKTGIPDPVNANNNLTYQINVTSNGNETSHNVTVEDTYPNEVIYLASRPDPLAGTNNTWILGNLTAGTNVSINITVRVLNITNGSVINNTATVSFRNTTGSLFTVADTQNTTVENMPLLNFTNISITKTNNPNPVDASTNLAYQINISNTGNGTAYNVTINDKYPNETIYLSALPAPATGTNNTWHFNLTAGTNFSINITVFVLNTSNGAVINNTANVSWQNETSGLFTATARANATVHNPSPPAPGSTGKGNGGEWYRSYPPSVASPTRKNLLPNTTVENSLPNTEQPAVVNPQEIVKEKEQTKPAESLPGAERAAVISEILLGIKSRQTDILPWLAYGIGVVLLVLAAFTASRIGKTRIFKATKHLKQIIAGIAPKKMHEKRTASEEIKSLEQHGFAVKKKQEIQPQSQSKPTTETILPKAQTIEQDIARLEAFGWKARKYEQTESEVEEIQTEIQPREPESKPFVKSVVKQVVKEEQHTPSVQEPQQELQIMPEPRIVEQKIERTEPIVIEEPIEEMLSDIEKTGAKAPAEELHSAEEPKELPAQHSEPITTNLRNSIKRATERFITKSGYKQTKQRMLTELKESYALPAGLILPVREKKTVHSLGKQQILEQLKEAYNG